MELSVSTPHLGDNILRQQASQLPPLSDPMSSGVEKLFASRHTSQDRVLRLNRRNRRVEQVPINALPERKTDDRFPSRLRKTGPVMRLGDSRSPGYDIAFDGAWPTPQPKDWLAPSYTGKGPVWRIGYSNLSNSIRERTLDIAVPNALQNVVAANLNPAVGNDETRMRPLADKSVGRDRDRGIEARGYNLRRDSSVYSL